MNVEGYPVIYPKRYASRTVYVLERGELAADSQLVRTCSLRRCVNPDHFRVAENVAGAFWRNVDQSGGPAACWPWQRQIKNNGYGNIFVGGRNIYAHRRAYELANGPVPDGLLVLHHCDNPPCCNPAHLYAGTYSQNTQDAISRGRHWSPFGKH